MYVRDTIAAISTPVGEGGIGIVRVSGVDAFRITDMLFRKKRDGGLQSHRFYYGAIVDPESSDCVDEVMVVQMRAPRSYTCEDVLEIHCHGGFLVVQRVLALVLQSGVRLAEPGEFTKRAFLNGRIDLVQAEAVIDVIRSKTEASLALAQHQREGLLSGRFSVIREYIVTALALVEAYIDFPEDDISGVAEQEIVRCVEVAAADTAALLAGFQEGKVLREGVSVLIVGRPNAGKSSLLNVLLREKRAIVTSQPGTTRDIIEEVVNMGGLPVRIIDTAGIREAEDLVEREGVRLALEKIPAADLILFVLDVTRPFSEEDEMIRRELLGSKVIVVCNKTDHPRTILLPAFPADWGVVDISASTGAGIDGLRSLIREEFLHGRAVDSRDYVSLSHHRHRDALQKCSAALERFIAGLAAADGPELLAVELREALHAVGEVTGETTPDDILDLIFGRFCIGK
jgi:tRNA modification GTPase